MPSSRTLEKNVEILSQALEESRLKIPVHIEAEGTSIELARSFAVFGPGSASVFCGTLNQVNNFLTLKGQVRILPFFRIYFQIFLSLAVVMSFTLIAVAVWKFFFELLRENRVDLVMLELAGGGMGVLLILVGGVKIMVALNYISTRGQRKKILMALHAIE